MSQLTREEYADELAAYRHRAANEPDALLAHDADQRRLLACAYAERDEARDVLAAKDERIAELERELAGAKHFMACANTPLMRDVLAERDAALSRIAELERACGAARGLIERADGEAVDEVLEQLNTALGRKSNDSTSNQGGSNV